MSILTRAEGYRAAGYSGTPSAADDSTMDEIVAAVDGVVERVAGADQLPFTARTFTARCTSGPLMLPWRFSSVTSVTVDGALVDPARYDAVSGAGSGVLRGVGGAPWAVGTLVVVVAVVGVVSVAPAVHQAAMFIAGHLWQILQQGGRGAYADEIAGMSAGYAVPNRARELLELDAALPGFA